MTRRFNTYLMTMLLLTGSVLYPGAASSANLPQTVDPGLGSLQWIVTNTGGTSSGTAFAGDCIDGVPGVSLSEARSANATSNSFDNAWMLFVDDVILATPTVDITGELMTAGPVVLSGLDTRLEILFSAVVQAARIRAIFTNPGNNAITVDVDVPINLGSDLDTLIEQTASIDNVFSIGDRWIITSESNSDLKAINTTVVYGPGTPRVTPTAVTLTVCNDSNNRAQGIGFSYRITIPARASRSLMFFAGLGDIAGSNNTVAGALANVTLFNSNITLPTRLVEDLTNAQRLEILNWDFATTINAATVEEDTTFIDDFLGCSLGSRATRDPSLLLLVLGAIAGLVRRRVLQSIPPDGKVVDRISL